MDMMKVKPQCLVIKLPIHDYITVNVQTYQD